MNVLIEVPRRSVTYPRRDTETLEVPMPAKYTPEKRLEVFWSKVDKNGTIPVHAPELGPCWLWTGAKTTAGYGEFWDGKGIYAHHFLLGRPSAGTEYDHLCRNHGCVRPSHLEAVSHTINILRGTSPSAFHAVKTHCPQGHPYDEKNTYHAKRGGRMCRSCNRLRSNQNYARKMGKL